MDTPFPFPWAQCVTIVLAIYVIFIPFLIAGYTTSVALATLMTFASVHTMIMLNEVARDIEDPFHYDPNELPLPQIQYRLNERLLSVAKSSRPVAFTDIADLGGPGNVPTAKTVRFCFPFFCFFFLFASFVRGRAAVWGLGMECGGVRAGSDAAGVAVGAQRAAVAHRDAAGRDLVRAVHAARRGVRRRQRHGRRLSRVFREQLGAAAAALGADAAPHRARRGPRVAAAAAHQQQHQRAQLRRQHDLPPGAPRVGAAAQRHPQPPRCAAPQRRRRRHQQPRLHAALARVGAGAPL